MTLTQIWTACLGELSLQMTKATFDTWVAPTQALEWENGRFVIGVPNSFAADWLENRLKTTIERTLVGIVGQPVRVTLLVTESADPGQDPGPKLDRPDQVAVKFYSFDPKGAGWLQTPKYDHWFWQPLVGCVAFAVYQFFRCEEKINRGWGDWFVVTVDEIAATLDVGRQEITGVQRKRRNGKGKYWQPGALDRLEEAGIAKIERLGRGTKISYRVSCLHSLPLLTPAQVERLDPILQKKHADFLRDAQLEQEEWLQLELPSLVQT
jgi:hypothetical protein